MRLTTGGHEKYAADRVVMTPEIEAERHRQSEQEGE
jgi:hypothetical protein